MTELDSLRVGVVTGPQNPDLTEGARELVAEFERRGASEVPYARVDGVLRDGQFLLMELELVEPYLWLGSAGGAVEALADAVEAAL